MSQGLLTIPSTGTLSGLTLVADINTAVDAVATNNLGSSAPANAGAGVAEEGMLWVDSTLTRRKLKLYDGTSWLTLGIYDNSIHQWMPAFGGGVGSIASAATTDLGTAAETGLTITGTTAITSFGSSAATGVVKFLTAAAAGLVLTYNATSMRLPGAANITMAAGDWAIVQCLGAGNWQLIDYAKADGTPLVLPIATAAVLGGVKQGSNILIAGDGTISANGSPTVRQTVLSGPQTAGVSTLFPATSASLTLTSQNVSVGAPLICTVANGFGSSGNVDVIGQSTANLSWTAAASNTNFHGVTIASGALTAFSTILAPIYQYGGAISVATGQYTFDISQMKMFLGNGTVANQVNAVFVGESVAGASTITSTVAYAYNGYYDSGWINTLPGVSTFTSKNSNLGHTDQIVRVQVKNLTAEGSFAVGDVNENFGTASSNPSYTPMPVTSTRNTSGFVTGNATAFSGTNKSNGAYFIMTLASWAFRIIARRGWGGA